jgi:hypothetical protein
MPRAPRSFPPKPGKNIQKPGKTGQFQARNRAKNRAFKNIVLLNKNQ